MDNKIYGYCRISTKKQSIERQKTNIKALYPNAIIITEEFTGTKIEGRKKFNNLLKRVEEGDTIVFDSVSRMSRNAEEGFKLYKELFEKGVSLVFIKEAYINTENYKKQIEASYMPNTENDIVNSILEGVKKALMLLAEEQIKIAFEQSEKEVKDLQQRTKEGIREARAKAIAEGTKLVIGREKGTKLTTKKSIEAKEKIKKYSKYFLGDLKDEDVMKLANVSRKSFYKYKKELVEELQQEQLKEEY